MPARRAECPACGARVPKDARFCPSCGTALDAGATKPQEIPPHETSSSPVQVAHAAPRWFGVTPPTLLLAVAAVAFVLAIVLVAAGSWVAGLLVLGLALLLVAGFLEVARRKPDAEVVKRAAGAADSVRARAGYAAHTLRTRSSVRRELTRRRAEVMRLSANRERLLRDLGAATYAGDEGAELRERIASIDARVEELEAEGRSLVEKARAEVEREALAVQPTEVARPGDRE